tara:strand:- start:528 stop:935 length:408 start_codon:yes stop_codon:yes gene_type:complete
MRVIFGYNSSFKSRVIRIRTLCKWSHVGIIIGDFVLEAQGGVGVVLTPIKSFLARYDEVEIRYLKGSVNKVLPLIGKPFDSLGAIGLFMNIPILKSHGAFICSGLVAIAADNIKDYEVSKATPKSIYKLTKIYHQ